MADNIVLSAAIGTGDTLSADEVGSVKLPYGKVDLGGNGVSVPWVAGQQAMAASAPVVVASDQTAIPVGDGGGSLTVDAPVGTPVFVRLSDGSSAIATLPVSAASLPLPSGAATAAKQPAIGTAGTASTDVITVQGIASMTALKIDGSAVTQPVSDGGGSLTVDGSVSVSGLVPGVSATSLGKAEDAVAADGDTGVMALAVRKDTAATTVGADGDYHPFEVDGNGRLWVNGSSVTQPVSAASLPLPTGASTAANQSTANTALAAIQTAVETIDNAVSGAGVNVSQINGVTPLMGAGNTGTGSPRVTIASDQAAIPVSQSGTWTVQPGNTANSTPWLTTDTPATSGGLSISRTLSANNTTGINAKGSAGQVYGWAITNTNAAARHVKLYNKATAPTVGSDTPVITLVVPGNTAGAGMVANFDKGIAFGTGIGYGITTGVADNDTGAPAANEVVVNLLYK